MNTSANGISLGQMMGPESVVERPQLESDPGNTILSEP